MTEQDFIDRYVKWTIENAGFTHFDDGTAVADYAMESARACYGNTDDAPEGVAAGDMEYWGEE
jgi:hypothetical protein